LAEVRYHFDEHMPGVVARELRRLGIDAETTHEAGLLGASDRAHLAHARAHGRVVVTEDADYRDLHDQGEPHSGIVYFPGGHRPIGELVESLRLVYESYSAEEMVGRLEYF
jgi:predicted nuclease of predicted toxin-antitoxin system